jgi:predicted nucleotidyltransferase
MISFRSSITQKLLTYFFLNKTKEFYVNELARFLNADPKNLDKKLKELEKEGIFKNEFRGKQRYYSINHQFPLLNEYEQIFNKTIGLEYQLKNILQKTKGLEEAYIFGSYASNKLDVLSDIDLLIIGSHKSLDVEKAILPLQKTIGREINIIDITKEEFEEKKIKKDPFIKHIFSKQIIKII